MDILDEMTKAELVGWIRGQFFFTQHPPLKSDLLFLRWQKQTELSLNRSKAHTDSFKPEDTAKHDEYRRQFNAATGFDKRLSIAKKMRPFSQKLAKFIDESKAIMKAERKLEKLYAQIDIERQKERNGK